MTADGLAVGDRVNHYTTRMPNGTGTVLAVAGEGRQITVKWDRSGITREVPAVNLRKVAR